MRNSHRNQYRKDQKEEKLKSKALGKNAGIKGQNGFYNDKRYLKTVSKDDSRI